jgi:hypothetical protein
MKHVRIAAILPVGKLFDRIFAEGITTAAKEAGAQCVRVTPKFSPSGQLGAICQDIEAASLVIADITAQNPHVMFLAGYAQGIGRELLFLARHGENFPFNPARHAAIIYAGDTDFLKSELLAHLRGNPKAAGTTVPDAHKQFMETFGDLLKKHHHEHRGEIQLENPSTYVLLNQDMDLPLVQDLARRSRELGVRIKLM